MKHPFKRWEKNTAYNDNSWKKDNSRTESHIPFDFLPGRIQTAA